MDAAPVAQVSSIRRHCHDKSAPLVGRYCGQDCLRRVASARVGYRDRRRVRQWAGLGPVRPRQFCVCSRRSRWIHAGAAQAAPDSHGHGTCFGLVIMSLLSILVSIVVVGVLLWVVNSFIPMDGKIRSILNVVVVIVLVLWLLQGFGILGALGSVRVG